MQVHEIKPKKKSHKRITTKPGENMATYVCLKEGLEYAGYVLKKGDQVVQGVEPVDGKDNSLVNLSEADLDAGKTPAFRLISGQPIEPEPEEDYEEAFGQPEDPRTKPQIAESLFQITGEKISPSRLNAIRKIDLVAMEKKALLERDKDGLTAVVEDEVI